METSSRETSSIETSSSKIILPAKSFFHGNLLPFSGGGGNMAVFDKFCGILCQNYAKPRKPSLAWKLLPARSFFRQKYSSVGTFFHFLAGVKTCWYLIRFVESYAENVQSLGNLRWPGNFFHGNYSPSTIFFHGKFLPFSGRAVESNFHGRKSCWKKIMLEEDFTK